MILNKSGNKTQRKPTGDQKKKKKYEMTNKNTES